MRTKNLLLSLLIAAGTALPVAGHADSDFRFGVTVGAPAEPAGFTPARWAWDGHQYVWVEGRRFAPRRGHVWVPGHWEGRGRYRHFVEGHYVREQRFRRSHDGFDRNDGFRGNDGFYRNW